jgi:hypothetical protein
MMAPVRRRFNPEPPPGLPGRYGGDYMKLLPGAFCAVAAASSLLRNGAHSADEVLRAAWGGQSCPQPPLRRLFRALCESRSRGRGLKAGLLPEAPFQKHGPIMLHPGLPSHNPILCKRQNGYPAFL